MAKKWCASKGMLGSALQFALQDVIDMRHSNCNIHEHYQCDLLHLLTLQNACVQLAFENVFLKPACTTSILTGLFQHLSQCDLFAALRLLRLRKYCTVIPATSLSPHTIQKVERNCKQISTDKFVFHTA